jgi:hypothetical protein
MAQHNGSSHEAVAEWEEYSSIFRGLFRQVLQKHAAIEVFNCIARLQRFKKRYKHTINLEHHAEIQY